VTDPIPALALGGGFLFLGTAALYLHRRRQTTR
jgi:LPXTG-motif cell wall-anchored protein